MLNSGGGAEWVCFSLLPAYSIFNFSNNVSRKDHLISCGLLSKVTVTPISQFVSHEMNAVRHLAKISENIQFSTLLSLSSECLKCPGPG